MQLSFRSLSRVAVICSIAAVPEVYCDATAAQITKAARQPPEAGSARYQ